MKLKFYGTRGSIPVCDAGFQQFGGNTTCFQITFPDMGRIHIIDAGTGLRNLGRDMRAIGHQQEDELVIAFTHFHWDHMQGFPFFAPAYNPRQKITILALGRDQTSAICGRSLKFPCKRSISLCSWIRWGPNLNL